MLLLPNRNQEWAITIR